MASYRALTGLAAARRGTLHGVSCVQPCMNTIELRPAPESSGPSATATPAQVAQSARVAVIGAVQRILEVLDGRRPCEHVSATVSAEVFGQVAVALKKREAQTARAPARGVAVRLRRVHLQMRSARAAEFFGTVERSGRMHAVAGRVELRPLLLPGRMRRPEVHWVLTEFGLI
ncbi:MULTISPECIES: Rv3235 family protein [Gordonia]|uniref:Rv3235 family protein n=1 Tax=Gordonia TaxID=2053 RepID=UPI0030FF087B